MEQLVIWILRLLIVYLALTVSVGFLGLIVCVAAVVYMVWKYKNEWD